MDFFNAMEISASGMKAQGHRLRVTAQNIANANTAANTPNAEPYQRKTVIFKNVLDRASGVEKVEVSRVLEAEGEFKLKYMPSHPGADDNGYIRTPKINTLIESMDMREAQRSYEANLGMVQISKAMLGKTIDLIGQ
jgi:flagellar basal-body rod protein FlgC